MHYLKSHSIWWPSDYNRLGFSLEGEGRSPYNQPHPPFLFFFSFLLSTSSCLFFSFSDNSGRRPALASRIVWPSSPGGGGPRFSKWRVYFEAQVDNTFGTEIKVYIGLTSLLTTPIEWCFQSIGCLRTIKMIMDIRPGHMVWAISMEQYS